MMSLADDSPQDAADASRRRASSVVSEHLRKIAPTLEVRGVTGRLFMGLWQSCIGAVISCLQDEDMPVLIRLIEDRSHSVKGIGANADSPLRGGPRESDTYFDEVNRAAEAISEHLAAALSALEEEDIEEFFPECVIDAMLLVLVPAWGPYHVRRALTEQWLLLKQGVAQVAAVQEPVRYATDMKGADRKERVRTSAPASEASPPPPPPEPTPDPIFLVPMPKRVPAERFVEAYAEGDFNPATGQGAWAAAINIHEQGGRQELRDICGVTPDPTGRASALRAVLEVLFAVGESESKALLKIDTSAEFIVRGMLPSDGGRDEGSRLDSEKDIWESMDRIAACHSVEWRHIPAGPRSDRAERCDRMVRKALLAAGGN